MFLIGIYLNRSYALFYEKINTQNLGNPNPQVPVLITPNETKSIEKQINLISLGDSLSSGVGANGIEGSFPYLIAKDLNIDGDAVILTNLSYPGATTKDVINNQLTQTAALQNADLITLLIGVNDIHNLVPAKTFQNNFKKIINDLTKNSKAQIVVINIPFLGSSKIVNFPYNLLLDLRTKQFNKIIEQEIADKNIIYIDLYNQTKNNFDFYSEDLFHPSAEGYSKWEEIIYAGINSRSNNSNNNN